MHAISLSLPISLSLSVSDTHTANKRLCIEPYIYGSHKAKAEDAKKKKGEDVAAEAVEGRESEILKDTTTTKTTRNKAATSQVKRTRKTTAKLKLHSGSREKQQNSSGKTV